MGFRSAVRLGLVSSLAVGLIGFGASATTLALSNASSDAGTLTADAMDAILTFSVLGDTLTLDVNNASASPIRMSEIYFNASSDVTSITLTSAQTHSSTGDLLWATSSSAASVGFGTFDYAVTSITAGKGPAREAGEILSGQTLSFVFTVAGTNVDASDFGTELSAAAGTDTAAYGAAFFHPNGGNNGATGALIATPEPATALMIALGLGILTRMGRQRRD